MKKENMKTGKRTHSPLSHSQDKTQPAPRSSSFYVRHRQAILALAGCAVAGLAPAVVQAGPPEFVEDDVEVLYYVNGEGPNQWFGYVGDAVGDVTGDDIPEIVCASPYADYTGGNTGRIYLINGKTGEIIRHHDGITNQAYLGFRIAPAGDVNNDDIADYAAAASGILRSNTPGELFVYSGADGSVLYSWSSTKSGDRLGHGICGLKDINGDGHDEIMYGIPGDDTAGSNAGRVIIRSGIDGTIMRTHEGLADLHRMGTTVWDIGDVDNDTFHDYAIGAQDAGFNRQGVVYVHSGSTGDLLYELHPSSARAADFGGYFANSVGDVDGDQVPDIFVGDWMEGSNGSQAGWAYVFSGADGTELVSTPGENITGNTGFGGRLLGDVNGDGANDIVTNFENNPQITDAPRAGQVRIISGKTGAVLRTITSVVNDAIGVGEFFGADCGGFPDINDDGIPEILATAIFNDDNGSRSGRLMIIAGNEPACLSIKAENLVAGSYASIGVYDGDPGAAVAVLVGFEEGNAAYNTTDWCADFNFSVPANNIRHRIVVSGIFDANGTFETYRFVHPTKRGAQVKLQATQAETCPDPCMSPIIRAAIK